MLKKVLQLFWGNKFPVLLILLGIITWSLTMIKSGWIYPYGIGFWGANGHDGIWHIALAESLSDGSFQMPVFPGEVIKNYHIGFDLILAGLHKITFIPIVNLYFQVLPPIFALLIGYLTYKFTYLWTRSKSASFWSIFFVYLGGSFGWILGKGESAFWSQQAISTLINPPFALSIIFILLGLIALLKKNTLLAILFFGPLIQIKAYAAVLVFGGLLISKKFKVFLGTLTVSLIFFLLTKSSGFPFVWQPFWFLETMMQLSDRVDWAKFGEAMVNYKTGGVWLKGILAYGIAFSIFVVGNFGTRIIALGKKFSSSMDIFIWAVIGAGILIPMFFLQKGTPWNTIQFFYYSLFFSSILAGIKLASMNRIIKAIIILVTIPTTVFTLKDVYLPSRPPAMISKNELTALEFLRKQSDGIVLTFPFDKMKAKEAETNPPRPLHLYESTAYVSAFSKHPIFLEDEVNLDITGYDWQTRRKEVENFFNEKDAEKAKEFLNKNNIKYVYWVRGQTSSLGVEQIGLIKIFENKDIEVFVIKS